MAGSRLILAKRCLTLLVDTESGGSEVCDAPMSESGVKSVLCATGEIGIAPFEASFFWIVKLFCRTNGLWPCVSLEAMC